MYPLKLLATPRSRPFVYSTHELVRSSLEKAKRIVVLVGRELSSTAAEHDQCTTNESRCHSVPEQPTPESPPGMAGFSDAHLALANFALPQVRRSIAYRADLTIITCNEDGTVKRALEHMFSLFGLVLPSSDGRVGLWSQLDPMLIELATQGRSTEDAVGLLESELDEPKHTASRIIADADLLLITGHASEIENFMHDIAVSKKRHATVVVFANETAMNYEKLQPDYVLTDPLSVAFPQVFAMDSRSVWFSDGSLRTFYPGVTVTTTPQDGQSVSYADVMNAVPRHSRFFAVDCGPFIPRPALSRAEITAMSEEDIVHLCQSSPDLANTPISRLLPVRHVYLLAANVVAKVSTMGARNAPEAAAMRVVRQQTSIPVPEVYRYFVHGFRSYLVMEYVQGECLDQCWEDLSNWEKVQIGLILRNYVRQMRRIRTPQIDAQIPGPIIDDLSHPAECEIPALGEYPAGPFSSYAHFRDWMNGRLRVSQQMAKCRYDGQMFDDSEPLVFTHGDLFLRNIIIGDDRRLWLIDFGCAGVYPRWFEVYGMLERTFLYPQPTLWTWTRKFAAGPYDEQERYIRACQQGLSVFLWPDPGPELLEQELASQSV